MKLKILLVEDTAHKRDRVTTFLNESYPDAELLEAYSFNSGSRSIEGQQFNVAILDLSLPTYDRTGAQGGGRFRTLGGREIARKLIRRSGANKIIFLTQYDTFSDKARNYSLESLVVELQKECGEHYVTTVFYDSAQSTWKDDLSRAMKRALNEDSSS